MAQVLTIASGTEAPAVNFHVQTDLPALQANEVSVRMLAAPINSLDILVLSGLYPVKPEHKHADEPVLGYDGVGEIVQVGSSVTALSPGDIVVPSKFGTGTWRTHAVLDAASLQKATRPHDLSFAAILRIGIAPAFCLVEDMRDLRPGDYIIQNAGTSLLAQFVIQFARRRGIHVINVVRERAPDELEAVTKSLVAFGADIVVSESALASDPRVKDKRITLALDSVFGASGRGLVKALSVGGTYVQLGFLGGSAGGPVAVDPMDLFARQLTMKGFRGSAQVGLGSAEEQRDLFNWFVDLFNRGELRLPALGLQKVSWVRSDAEGARVVFSQLWSALERVHWGSGSR